MHFKKLSRKIHIVSHWLWPGIWTCLILWLWLRPFCQVASRCPLGFNKRVSHSRWQLGPPTPGWLRSRYYPKHHIHSSHTFAFPRASESRQWGESKACVWCGHSLLPLLHCVLAQCGRCRQMRACSGVLKAPLGSCNQGWVSAAELRTLSIYTVQKHVFHCIAWF